MTFEESKAWVDNQEQNMQASADKLATDAEQVTNAQKSRAALRDRILEDIKQGSPYSDSVNRAYAELHNSFYHTMAPVLGMTPEAMYEKYSPAVMRGDIGGGYNAETIVPPTEVEVAKWQDSIKGFTPGRSSFTATMRTPTVLAHLGEKSKTLSLSNIPLNEIARSHPDVPLHVLENLPALLHDPIAVLPHPEDGLNVVLDARTAKGEPIIVGVRDGRIRTITPVNDADGRTGTEILRDRVQAALRTKQGEIPSRTYYRGDAENKEPAGSPQGEGAGSASARASEPLSLGELFRQHRNVTTKQRLVNQFGENYYQMAWHGSPFRDIEKQGFKLEHIGKGQGMQVFGYGINLGGARSTAEGYRESVRDMERIREINAQMEKVSRELDQYRTGEYGRFNDPRGYDLQAEYFRLMAKRQEAGQLYSAEIPDDHELLDWDKPFSEQPEQVKAALEKVFTDPRIVADVADYRKNTRQAPFSDNTAGAEIYGALADFAGGAKEASEILRDAGVPGLRYLDRVSGEGTHNYVIWDESRLNNDIRTYYQDGDIQRGLYSPDKNAIAFLKDADLSTFLHESGHFFLGTLRKIAAEPDAPPKVQAMLDTLAKWQGDNADLVAQEASGYAKRDGYEGEITPAQVRDYLRDGTTGDQIADAAIDRAGHEWFARGFEQYLMEGKSPNLEMQSLFSRFASWLKQTYQSLRGLNVPLSDEVRQVFDTMLASDEDIRRAEQVRGYKPLFESADEAAKVGVTPEDFAGYQGQAQEATDMALAERETRSLRNMKWLANAKSRFLKMFQREAADLRVRAEWEARREVMSQPVYQAWQFLTGKIGAEDRLPPMEGRQRSADSVDETRDSLFRAIAKLGGLNRDAAISEWGSQIIGHDRTGLPFGKPLLRAEGGKTIDEIAEALGQYGYLKKDKNGKVDLHEFEDKFHQELVGNLVHSDYHQPQGELRAGEQIQNPSALGAARLDIGALRERYGAVSRVVQEATPERKAVTLDEAKTGAANFVGKPLENKATGLEGTVSNNALRKMTSQSAVSKSTSVADHALAVANLDKLFSRALLNETHPDRDGEPTIKAVHRFVAPMVNADGDVRAVKITVKETAGANEPNPIYTVETLSVEKPVRIAPDESGIERVMGGDAVATHPTDGLNDNVRQAIEAVKQHAASDSMLVKSLVDKGMTANNGLDPDLAADILRDEDGNPLFTSGDEMVRALADAQPPEDVVQARTDQIMLERHGDLADPESQERAAEAAIHNTMRARVIATEMAALAKATGSARDLVRAAKEAADAAIAARRVGDLNPKQYLAAEAKSARAAAEAFRKGDIAEAAKQKRAQLLNNQLYRSAMDAQERIQKIIIAQRRFDKEGTRKRIDPDILEQIDALREKYIRYPIQQNKPPWKPKNGCCCFYFFGKTPFPANIAPLIYLLSSHSPYVQSNPASHSRHERHPAGRGGALAVV